MSEAPTEQPDIIERLRAACNGHPVARIAWPHRVLHDAIAEIADLRRQLAEAQAEIFRLKDRVHRLQRSYMEGPNE